MYNHKSEAFTFGATISNHGAVVPIEIDEKKCCRILKVKRLIYLLNSSPTEENDIYYAILDAIRSFSEITSTANKYDKIVKLISFFEAILIDKRGKKGHGETIIKAKLMPQNY